MAPAREAEAAPSAAPRARLVVPAVLDRPALPDVVPAPVTGDEAPEDAKADEGCFGLGTEMPT